MWSFLKQNLGRIKKTWRSGHNVIGKPYAVDAKPRSAAMSGFETDQPGGWGVKAMRDVEALRLRRGFRACRWWWVGFRCLFCRLSALRNVWSKWGFRRSGWKGWFVRNGSSHKVLAFVVVVLSAVVMTLLVLVRGGGWRRRVLEEDGFVPVLNLKIFSYHELQIGH